MFEHKTFAAAPFFCLMLMFLNVKFLHGAFFEQYMPAAILYRLVPVMFSHLIFSIGIRLLSQPEPEYMHGVT